MHVLSAILQLVGKKLKIHQAPQQAWEEFFEDFWNRSSKRSARVGRETEVTQARCLLGRRSENLSGRGVLREVLHTSITSTAQFLKDLSFLKKDLNIKYCIPVFNIELIEVLLVYRLTLFSQPDEVNTWVYLKHCTQIASETKRIHLSDSAIYFE